MISGLLCPLAGALYAAAILLYDTRFGFLLRVMPWLMSAVCCVILDILVSLHGAEFLLLGALNLATGSGDRYSLL